MRQNLGLLLLALLIGLSACGGPMKEADPNSVVRQPPAADTAADEGHYTTAKPEAELAGLVPEGMEVVVGTDGPLQLKFDMNGDSLPDHVLLLQDLHAEEGSCRIFASYSGSAWTKAHTEISGDLGPEPLMSPQQSDLKVQMGDLYYHYQSMRWEMDAHFQYARSIDGLRLVGMEVHSYGNAVHDGSGKTSIDFLKGTRTQLANEWSEEKQDLVPLPESRTRVSTAVRRLSTFNQDSIYAY